MKRLACLVALVAATASADDKKYTLADLEDLVAKSAWIEGMQHLEDVPPAKRTSAWITIATKVLVGVANSEDGWRMPRVLELEDRNPSLLASPVYVKARAPVMLGLVEQCIAADTHAIYSCVKIAHRAAKAVRADRAFAFDVAKLLRRTPAAGDSLPMFVLALGPKEKATVCNDEDLKLAVIGGLGEDYGDERLAEASSLAFTSCWSALKAPILDELGKPDVKYYFRANVCKRLAAKRVKHAACAKKG